MTQMELKKLQVQYKQVNAAREEQEMKVMELLEQIDRIEKSIEISKAKEEELLSKIKAAQG